MFTKLGQRTGLALAALLLMVSCNSQDNPEMTLAEVPGSRQVASLEASVESLQQEIESLRAGVASLSQGTAAAQASELASRIEALETEIAALNYGAEARHTATMDHLDRLAADLSVLSREASAGDSSTGQPDEPAFTLQLLHASDMDDATGGLSNVENFSAILDSFRRQYPDNTLVLSSGDNYVPGPRYYAAGDVSNDPVLGVSANGRGDIALLNPMGFQASAVGNHDLDRGTREVAASIGFQASDSGAYPGAGFPYLASN